MSLASRSLFSILLVALSTGSGISAQETSPAQREAVLAAVDSFFSAMTRRDTLGSRAILLPGAMFYHIVPGREPRATSDTAYINSFRSLTANLRERIWNPRVEVHGPIAEVWTRYDFHVDGKFSHCGVDDFSLVRTPFGWRIASATYTIEMTGCPESPLGTAPPGLSPVWSGTPSEVAIASRDIHLEVTGCPSTRWGRSPG